MYGADMDELISKYGKADGSTYRILLVGGSTAQGFPTGILEEAFKYQYPEKNFEVINLAFGGYNARQEVVIASIWGSQLRPDMLISLTGANDLTHRLRMDKAGSFYLDDSYRFILTHPYLSPIAELLRHSQLRNGIERLLARKKLKDVSVYEDAVPIFLEAQHSLNMLAKGACAQRIMVLQPFHANKKPMSSREKAFTRYKYREGVVMTLFDKAGKGLASLARDDGVLYLDGRNIYDGMKETIFTDDVHFKGDQGYRILANRIVSTTSAQQLTSRCQ